MNLFRFQEHREMVRSLRLLEKSDAIYELGASKKCGASTYQIPADLT